MVTVSYYVVRNEWIRFISRTNATLCPVLINNPRIRRVSACRQSNIIYVDNRIRGLWDVILSFAPGCFVILLDSQIVVVDSRSLVFDLCLKFHALPVL